MPTLRATTFAHSHSSFLEELDKHGIEYNRRIELSEEILASGVTIEIILSGVWGTLAVACIAWVQERKSRHIKITTKDNKIIDLKGYSAEEATQILEQAKRLDVIDTKPTK